MKRRRFKMDAPPPYKFEFQVDKIEDRGYWFVRTNGGLFYDEYKNENFIAVGYNNIVSIDLKKISSDSSYKDALIEKIKVAIDTNDTKQIRPTLVFNQLNRFINEMQIGDIVLIPSVNSQYISFGEITGNLEIITSDKSTEEEGKCPFAKRRKIRWVRTISREKLDPYLYKAIYSHHVITDVSESSGYINRSLSSLYVENNKAHITFRVNTTNDIALSDIRPFLYSFENIAKMAELPDEIIKATENMKIKINVQSPGPIEYICATSVIMLIAAIIGVLYVMKVAKEQGGSFNLSIGIKGFSFGGSFNPPKEQTADELAKKIMASPTALQEITKMAAAIEKLDVSGPTEKKD